MDMDLWWCPVCERAITDKKEPPMDLTKHSSNPPSPPLYTSLGGVYGSQESLYCSEACRRVEELNGRFAFEQLAACLPVLCDRRTCSEEPESEGTLSGTDEPNTDRSRSLSLGAISAAASQRTSTSSSFDVNLSNPDKPKTSDPVTSKPLELSLQVRPNARRVPILLSPNGTPLVQPIFPQRPAITPHLRSHNSHLLAVKPTSPRTTTALHAFQPIGRLAANPFNSAPTCAPGAVGHLASADRTRKILNTSSATRDDMEFGADARLEKPTFLWRHYSLFYRPRPGSRRGEWAECSDPSEIEYDSIRSLEKTLLGSTRQPSQAGNCMRNTRTSPVKSRNLSTTPDRNRVAAAHTHDSRLAPTREGYIKEIQAAKFPTKNRKMNLLAESKCSRSWSWDHLPADVPQYPAMDLELIRVSKLIRDQKLGRLENSSNNIESQMKSRPSSVENSSSVTTIIPSSKVPIQTKKKLFLFQ